MAVPSRFRPNSRMREAIVRTVRAQFIGQRAIDDHNARSSRQLHSRACFRWLTAAALALVGTVATMARAKPPDSATASCPDCHAAEAKDFSISVHVGGGISCRDCHHGLAAYSLDVARVEHLRKLASSLFTASTRPASVETFDHGPDFRGRPSRRDIPDFCGKCHSDVTTMNPYGLPTDQLAQYRTSGHGKALYQRGDERVAVCTGCHGRHAILTAKDPASSTYPKNVPATCGHCHGDPSVMAGTGLSTRVLEQYRESVHGKALLERGDLGVPECATCHGSHSAVPPGFRDVGHVCGRCHPQETQNFLHSFHAQFPLFPRCVACHTAGPEFRDHRIQRLAVSAEGARKAYDAAVQALGPRATDPAALLAAYSARREPKVPDTEMFCRRCHNAERETAHRAFFGDLDRQAAQTGHTLYELVRDAEVRYAATADHVRQVGQGVLLVTDESLMLEEVRTKLVNIGALQHTLDLEKVKTATGQLNDLASQIEQSLRQKERSLRWRHWALIPLWSFLILFVAVLWVKYKQLKAEMVVPLPPAGSVEDSSCPLNERGPVP